MISRRTINATLATVSLTLLGIGTSNLAVAEQILPPSTAVPVQFTRTIDAKTAKPGDPITAKTMQGIVLPNGQMVAKGASVVGHVVEARPYIFDPTPYAAQKPSSISVHFDKIVENSTTLPMTVAVRALADARLADQAKSPQYVIDLSSDPVMFQIGGEEFYPSDERITTEEGNVVAYNRKQGVFARLMASDYDSLYAGYHCDSASVEQSVAVFSGGACGLYGFDTRTYIPDNGKDNGGTFRLESRGYTVELENGSAALLQVLPQGKELAANAN